MKYQTSFIARIDDSEVWIHAPAIKLFIYHVTAFTMLEVESSTKFQIKYPNVGWISTVHLHIQAREDKMWFKQ